MKIVVIGGTGLVGSNVIEHLRRNGHEAVAAAPSTGVNALTGEGLADALAGAQVVVDVTNSPSFEDGAVMRFFMTSTRNLLAAEAAAGVEHHLALSIVGADRLPDSGYFRAKVAQEALIKASPLPYAAARHAVLRVRGRHRRGRHGGWHGVLVARAHPARRGRRCIGRAGPGRGGRRAAGRRRRACALLRQRAERPLAGDRRGPRIAPTRFLNWLSRAAAQA